MKSKVDRSMRFNTKDSDIGKWVACIDGEVVVRDKSFEKMHESLDRMMPELEKSRPGKRPVVFRVPAPDMFLWPWL